MSLAGGWILAPIALAPAVLGIGLLVERAAGTRLPGALVPGAGLAGLIALAGIPTVWDATAELAVPLCAAAALAGLVLGRPWADGRLRAAWPWPLVVAAGAFALYAAPSLLTGQGSIAGYVKLDDSATWLALTDHVFERGRDLSGLAPSSYRATLESWLAGGYPVGAFMPLGVTAALTGQDVANAYQPVIAVLAAIAGLGLYAAVRELAASRAAAAAAALVAVQASLFLGYAQWGGIKEAATVALLPVLALGARRSPLVAAVAVGAIGGVYGVDGMAWGLPALAIAAVAVALARAWSPSLLTAGAVLAAGLVPVLATLEFAKHTTAGAISAQEDLGNLVAPLSLLEGLGLWPAGDFRLDPDPRGLAVALALGGALAAIGAVALAARRRAADLPLLVALTLAGVIPALLIGSPWVDAKALAILSPVLLAGAAGLVAAAGIPRAAAAAGATVLALGAAWSTLAVARDVQVAPRARLAELRELADRVEGPAVLLDFEIYGSRHLLRDVAGEGATDLRMRTVARRDGTLFPELATAEVDEISTPELWKYRTIVRRRTPVGSRPPAAFQRTFAGRYFEAWERAAEARMPAARLPLADGIGPAGAPVCADVRGLARLDQVTALAAAPREPPVLVDLEGFAPGESTAGEAIVDVPEAGRWRVWVGGSIRARLEVRIAGRSLGAQRHELSHDGQWLRFGVIDLTAGEHAVELRVTRGLRAGMGAADRQTPLGPLALTPVAHDDPGPVERVALDDYRTLCEGGRTYDWIEGVP